MHSNCIFHVPLKNTPKADVAGGDAECSVDPKGTPPLYVYDGVRYGARFSYDTCVYHQVNRNFRREAGTVSVWYKPDYNAQDPAKFGRILWDMRFDYGSIVEDDPSQRWALVHRVYKTPEPGEAPPADPGGNWRFCVATDRSNFLVGTRQKRPDQRTRQAVFGTPQDFKAGTWMHLAITWTSDTGMIFVDGRQHAHAVLGERLPDMPLPHLMQLGAMPSWINASACGVLSDFRIYDRALGESEIQEEM
jgi:hypothetical protein